MNKTEKIWVAVLIAALVAYMGWQQLRPRPEPAPLPAPAPTQQAQPPAEAPDASVQEPTKPAFNPASQTFHVLENGQVRLTFSNLGARLVRVELLDYRAENKEDAGHVTLETGDLLNLSFAGAAPYLTYTVRQAAEGETALVFATALPDGTALERTVALGADYALTVRDSFLSQKGACIDNERLHSIRRALLEGSNETPNLDEMDQLTSSTQRKGQIFKLPTVINYLSEHQKDSTSIEVSTLDRPGLLAKIGITFSELDIYVRSARITTTGERADDFFNITDKQGRALSERLKDKLLKALQHNLDPQPKN